MKLKLYLILIMAVAVVKSANSQGVDTNKVMCSNYTFDYTPMGCNNFLFEKTCDIETIWHWGDGTPNTTSKNMKVVHQFCNPGDYVVSIRHVGSQNVIRYTQVVYADFPDYPQLSASFQIISQQDCKETLVQFNSVSTCIETYDTLGNVIPESTLLIWDFGDGTTAIGTNPKHVYSMGGNFVVTVKPLNSNCDLQQTLLVNINDPVTCCLDNINFNYEVWMPADLQSYSNTTLRVKKEIRLKKEAQLTLTNVRLEMGKDAKIIIERGAQLELINSTITTTNCGGYVWEGIEVWGSGNGFEQVPSLPNLVNGVLIVKGSTIENADEAISITKKIGLNFFDVDKNYNGGYIDVRNSTFKNNYTSINMWPYINCEDLTEAPCNDCNKYRNASHIMNNSFICSSAMRDPKYTLYTDDNQKYRLGISHFIYINNNFNVELVNNNFVNNYLTIPTAYRGIGVRSIHSKVSIEQDNVLKGFRGLTTGILTSADNAACKMTKISKNSFINCQVAIDANSTALSVQNNLINIPNTNSKLTTQGIHTRNCKNFDIKLNTISGASVGKKYGVLLRNNRSGFLLDNYHIGLFVGSQAEMLNEATAINCNIYQNQKYSIVVQNGKIADQGRPSLSAGNSFIDVCLPESNNINHIKSKIPFKYYFGGNVSDIPYCSSVTIDQQPAFNNRNCNIKLFTPCPAPCTKAQYLGFINQALTEGDVLEAERLKSEMAIELLSMEGGYEEYLDYLQSISDADEEAVKFLISTYYSEGKYNEMYPLLNQIAENPNEESKSFVDLYKMLLQAASEKRGMDELQGEEILLLNDLKKNDTTTAGYIAESMLYQLYNYEYDHNPMEMEENAGRAMSIELNDNLDKTISIFPNPANNYLNIESRSESIDRVVVYDLLGKVVLEKVVRAKNGLIGIEYLQPGLYTLHVYTNNGVYYEKLLKE